MKILVLHGPNLNLLGQREPEHYGRFTLDMLEKNLVEAFPEHQFTFLQSNHEGVLIDAIQQANTQVQAIILNAGGYSHTSVALADALKLNPVPTIEVHISNVLAREPFRHVALLAPHVKGVISGFGQQGYFLAVLALTNTFES